MDLRKETRLHLLGDFDFLGGTALGLQLFGKSAPLRVDAAGEFIKSGEAEGVSVGIFKARVDSAPGGGLRWKLEANSPVFPFVIFAVDVFGNEPDARLAADELFHVRTGIDGRKTEVGVAIRRRHLDPASTVFELMVYGDAEPKLVDEKTQAAFLIPNEDDDEVEAQIRIRPIEAQ